MDENKNKPGKPLWHRVVGLTGEEMPKAAREAEERYGDIIDLEHPEPKHHPRMDREARAAQFAPFAALTGYEDVIDEAVVSVEENYKRRR